jgi:cell division protein FtsB
VEIQAMQLHDNQEKIAKEQKEIDYNQSRVDFLKRNLPKLSKGMKTYEQSTITKINEIQNINEALAIERNCDPLLDISENEKNKINVLAAR